METVLNGNAVGDDTISGLSTTTASLHVRRFPFQDLPAEIRLMIYRHALVGRGAIYIIEGQSDDDNESLTILGSHLSSSIGYFDYDVGQAVDDIVETQITVGLAALHPALVQEANTVLYSQNEFIFDGFHTLTQFLTDIGSNSRCYLRHVEVIKCCYDNLDNAAHQVAMGLLSEATQLKHLHFGLDAALPFILDPDDRAAFTLDKETRHKKVAKYLADAVACVFRAQRTTPDEFLSIFSVHPTTFEFCDHLPRMPFLKWEKADHFTYFDPCVPYTEFLAAAAELRAEMKPLLETIASIKVTAREPWGAKKPKDAQAGSKMQTKKQ